MKHLRNIFLLLSLISISGCGGGGSDSNDSGGGNGLSNDACAALGLSSRIITGTECSTTNSPVVPITLFFGDGSGASCSGTMIAQTFVLSAGHCFPPEVRAAYIVANGVRIDGTRFYRHPGYTPTAEALFKDVAILELETNANLPLVPLVTSTSVSAGDQIQIFGWGKDENGNAGVLKSGEMLVDAVTDDHIISSFDGDGSNTCQGDSGGPALLEVNGQFGIVGITSTGSIQDCSVGDTSLFANTQSSSYLGFIQGVVPSASTL